MSSTRPVSRCRAQLLFNQHVFACEMPADREHSSHTAAEVVDGRLVRVLWQVDYAIPIPRVEVS
jgi:hypothetical protein